MGFNTLGVGVRDLSRVARAGVVGRGPEFSKTPDRSLQRLRTDFFEEIGYSPAVTAAFTASARMQVL
jgi:hypothetical protein